MVDVFASHGSVVAAAHDKIKTEHPDLHAKYMAASKLVQNHEEASFLEDQEGADTAATDSTASFLELLDREHTHGLSSQKFMRVRFKGGIRVRARTPKVSKGRQGRGRGKSGNDAAVEGRGWWVGRSLIKRMLLLFSFSRNFTLCPFSPLSIVS